MKKQVQPLCFILRVRMIIRQIQVEPAKSRSALLCRLRQWTNLERFYSICYVLRTRRMKCMGVHLDICYGESIFGRLDILRRFWIFRSSVHTSRKLTIALYSYSGCTVQILSVLNFNKVMSFLIHLCNTTKVSSSRYLVIWRSFCSKYCMGISTMTGKKWSTHLCFWLLFVGMIIVSFLRQCSIKDISLW